MKRGPYLPDLLEDVEIPAPRVNTYPIDEMRVLREAMAAESSEALEMAAEAGLETP